jgi:hypothetical protein
LLYNQEIYSFHSVFRFWKVLRILQMWNHHFWLVQNLVHRPYHLRWMEHLWFLLYHHCRHHLLCILRRNPLYHQFHCCHQRGIILLVCDHKRSYLWILWSHTKSIMPLWWQQWNWWYRGLRRRIHRRWWRQWWYKRNHKCSIQRRWYGRCTKFWTNQKWWFHIWRIRRTFQKRNTEWKL